MAQSLHDRGSGIWWRWSAPPAANRSHNIKFNCDNRFAPIKLMAFVYRRDLPKLVSRTISDFHHLTSHQFSDGLIWRETREQPIYHMIQPYAVISG